MNVSLDPDLPLRRALNITVKVCGDNVVWVRAQGLWVQMGMHGLALLDLLQRPRTLKEIIRLLEGRMKGVQDWMDVTSSVQNLWEADILLAEGGSAMHTLNYEAHGFDQPGIHVAMLNDHHRTSHFLRGIREGVRPGDLVVDIGTGTGILAMEAARAGARHVFAIEVGRIGQVARQLFAENHLSDRITLISGWSTQITLPERADVMISETIGNDPLGEQVLEITRDAFKRLLKPAARLIPSQLQVFGLPVVIPPSERKKWIFTQEESHQWRNWYGMTFDPLFQVMDGTLHCFFIEPYLARTWSRLSDPIPLASFDFHDLTDHAIDSTQETTATDSGILDGLLIYFKATLGPTTCLTTAPSEVDEDCHWKSPVWLITPGISLKKGDRFQVRYRHRVTGPPVEFRALC
jgi:protein arginine N-methyltransferase 1